MLNQLKKNSKWIVPFVITLTALLIAFFPKSEPALVYENQLPVANAAAFYPAGPIFADAKWEESFVFQAPVSISRVKILLATYARVNKGQLHLELKNGNSETLVSEYVDLSSVKDNEFLTWDFKSQRFAANQTLVLSITSTAKNSENGVAIYMTNTRSEITKSSVYSSQTLNGSAILSLFG